MSGPVAKSLRGKKKKKDGGNLPAGNERKIEQVGKLSLPRVARPSSSVIEHAAVRFAKMSLRLQTNDRLWKQRVVVALLFAEGESRKVSLRENSRIGRLHGEINSRQPRSLLSD